MSSNHYHPAHPTPLIEMEALARKCRVGRVLLKAENERSLGNFKSLGAGHAVSVALARAADNHLAQGDGDTFVLPSLVCASDGNHGLAVAAAAKSAGTSATVYLPMAVSSSREKRIADLGAKVIRVMGTYDDAVAQAELAARESKKLLIADTTSEIENATVADVMDGYGRIASEIMEQLRQQSLPSLTHMFVQAGVGGFAAAMVNGLGPSLAAPRRVAIIEPANAACVAAGLRFGAPVRLKGELETCAEMLSCGLASAPALAVLLGWKAVPIEVSEPALRAGPSVLRSIAGPSTTPSGAAGVTGLLAAAGNERLRTELELDETAVVLVFVTESTEPLLAHPVPRERKKSSS